MARGPFGGPRPFGLGPFTSSEEETEESDEESDIKQLWQENRRNRNEDENNYRNNTDLNLDNINDPTARAVLEMANSWFEEITKPQSKRKMIRNYLRETLDEESWPDERIEQTLDEAGL